MEDQVADKEKLKEQVKPTGLYVYVHLSMIFTLMIQNNYFT